MSRAFPKFGYNPMTGEWNDNLTADYFWSSVNVSEAMPLYRRDLDLVALGADCSIASFCTIWFDDVSRTAYFEPVATVPNHQRMDLDGHSC